jgi:hypothetical protein
MTSKVVPPGTAELGLPHRNVILCRTCQRRTVEDFLAWLEETAPGTVEGTVGPDGEGLVRYQTATWQPWVPPPGSTDPKPTPAGMAPAPGSASRRTSPRSCASTRAAATTRSPRESASREARSPGTCARPHHGELRLEVEAGQDGRQAVPLRFRLAK